MATEDDSWIEDVRGSNLDFFAKGTEAKHPFGVLYQGEHETPWDGTNVAVRLHARALSGKGLPVLLRSFSNSVVNDEGVVLPVTVGGIPQDVKDQIGHLRKTSVGALIPLIKHAVVAGEEHLNSVIGVRGAIHKNLEDAKRYREGVLSTTILYSVWERDRIAPELVKLLNKVAECWVPCEQNKQALQSSGVERVVVVPHPFDATDKICGLTQRSGKFCGGWKKFYSIGSWQPRKGFHELLGAFLHAYGPTDRATLTIKYSGWKWGDYPTPKESIVSWVNTPAVQSHGWNMSNVFTRVSLVGGMLPRDEIIRLHFMNNIYVCSSHGEAWCIPAFESKVAGNRMVHVPFGGTADFCDGEDVAVPFWMSPVHSSYKWGDCEWADFSAQNLRDALLSVEAPAEHRRPDGFDEKFGIDAVGTVMLGRVMEIVGRVRPEAEKYFRSML